MRFRLAPKSNTFDDMKFEFSKNYRGISHILEATIAKRSKIDPYCQRQRCNPLNTIRYDTIEEINVDSKAEYTAKSSTRSQKLKQSSAPLIQYRLRSVKSVRKE